MRATAHLIAILFLSSSCTGDIVAPEDDPMNPDPEVEAPVLDPLDGLPTGTEQWTDLCSKGYSDTVTQAFCAGNSPPPITSFGELRTFLGLGGDDISNQSNLKVTAVYHSTAVGGRFVTPLNPRVFFMPTARGGSNPSNPRPDPTYNIIAFSRGELFVELASKDTVSGEPRFFLFRFHLPCEDAPGGCTLADLLTPATESDWTSYTLYDDEAVANTTLDCMRCHQPDGPGTRKILRMQELRNPWNHWFYPEISENIAAIDAFEAAHANERYGDLPATHYRGSRPFNLQRIIQNNDFLDQPNEFDSQAISMELAQNGTSPTWDALYDEAVAGRAIPVPFAGNPQVAGNWDFSTPFQPVLDPQSRVAQMIRAYNDVMSGAMPRGQMPDIRDIFLDSALDAMGYRPKPGLDGRAIMVQVCSGCHNSKLDQSLTRAKFDVDTLDTLSRQVKDKAIQRMMLSDENVRKMPPARFHTLSDAERDLVIQELMK